MKNYFKYFVLVLIGIASLSMASAQNYFRSVATGNWNALATWESSPDNITWSAATVAPNSLTDFTVTIQSPNTVTITGSTMTIDEVVINTGATLTNSLTGALTINNGAGIDLAIYGTFIDNSATSITWQNAATTWLMGTNGTLIKSTGNASNPWQTHYNGGIATIPSTAYWILRKTLAGATNDPALSTTSPATGSVYPNLTIENNTASPWVTGASSSFSGSTIFPTIKGNFDIGGSGTNTVDFLNGHTYSTPTRITGNLIIRPGSTLRNNGTGIEIRGDITVNGTINYSGTSKVLFGGANIQTILPAAGTINVYTLEINKAANDVIVNKSFTVDNNINFIQGRFFTTSANLITVGAIATATNYNNSSFISGPCIKTGTPGFTFPVGKGNNVQPIGMNSGAAGLPSPFWTEGFGTGCSQNNPANGTVTTNGTWTVVSTGTNDTKANKMFIGATEAGMGAGVCGDGCINNGSLTNRTLHVGNVSGSPLAFLFCPSGDCGAAYDAGFGTNAVRTNVRAQSPVINCSGKTSITLSFNYMEGGDANDNATLWYYDGASWAQLVDMNKTIVCGSGQGLWTNYSIILPTSADNNPAVQIGFNWTNNDDGAGGDPSFAVDDITLSIAATESFSAEYFPVNPQTLFGNNLEPTLNHISYCEYWDLTRLSGASNRQVTLWWDNYSCGVTSLPDLRVARYDAGGNIWRDHGNGSVTGTTAAGTITSSLFSTQYCPYTLASVNNLNPLPVSFLRFDASAIKNYAELNWITATEPGNDFFTIQKSITLSDIVNVSVVSAKGNVNAGASYTSYDYHPFDGISYYRLKQTDVNGNASYTTWRTVSFKNLVQQLEIIPGNNGIDFSTAQCCSDNNASVKIFDAYGKLVFDSKMKLSNHNHIDLYTFSQGIYFLIAEADGKVFSEKFHY